MLTGFDRFWLPCCLPPLLLLVWAKAGLQSKAEFTALLRDKVTNFAPSAVTKNVEICLFKS